MSGYSKGRVRCTEVAEWSGAQCQAKAMIGSDPPKCRTHGGQINLMNTDLNINFKKGRWAKYLPQNLSERYEAAKEDTELLSLHDEAALLDTRLSILLDTIDTGEAGGLWRRLSVEVGKYKQQIKRFRGKPPEEITDEFHSVILPVIEQGASDSEKWKEIRDIIAERKKVVESERRRLVEMQQIMTLTEASALQRAIFEIIRNEVKDPSVIQSIATQIKALSTIGPS